MIMMVANRESTNMTQRKLLLAGNWKMNGSMDLVQQMAHALIQQEKHPNVTCALLAPYLFIPELQQTCQKSDLKWGAQHLHPQPCGAYTGDVNATLLEQFSCHYVLLGHSERRQYHQEDEAFISQQLETLADSNIEPILCIGESLQEREQNTLFERLTTQLQPILTWHKKNPEKPFTLAYEPIWAIGTGITATVDQAGQVHEWIRKQLQQVNETLASQCKILYGGSMKPDNAAALLSHPDIDGGLVGGASLKVDLFTNLVTLCNNCYSSSIS